jgi:hypothetical protein
MIGKEESKLEVNYHLMAYNANLHSGGVNHLKTYLTLWYQN